MFNFLFFAVSWVLMRWHSLFVALGLNPTGDVGWTLSIVFLVITVRGLLLRSVLRQAANQRKMRDLQPAIKQLTVTHKGDAMALQKKVLQLHRDQGVNPLAMFGSMIWQAPIFFGLSHVLRYDVHMFSALAPTIVLVVLASIALFTTQKLALAHRPAPENPLMAQATRAMPYLIPLGVVISSFVAPLGLLVYVCATNLWTCGQTYWLARTGRL